MDRTEIIKELQKARMITDSKDCFNVTHALEQGKDLKSILWELPELKRWPQALAFLKERL